MKQQAPKLIGTFQQTYDTFGSRLDEPRTKKLHSFFSKQLLEYDSITLLPASSIMKKAESNEALRTAFYLSQQHKSLDGIFGLRVIEDRHTSVLYHNYERTPKSIYDPLAGIISLNSHQVLIESAFIVSLFAKIRDRLLKNWAVKKGITHYSRLKLSHDDWLFPLHEAFSALEGILASNKGEKKKGSLAHMLLGQMASEGYISESAASILSKSEAKLKQFVMADCLHDLTGALRLINSSLVAVASQYRTETVGLEIGHMLLGQLALATVNEKNTEVQRNIISSEMQELTSIIDNDHSAAHISLFYVPKGLQGHEVPPRQTFVPCVDLQLTVSCADQIISDATMQDELVYAFVKWARNPGMSLAYGFKSI